MNRLSPEDRAWLQISDEWRRDGIDYPADARDRIEETFDFQRRVLAFACADLRDAVVEASPFTISAKTLTDRLALFVFVSAAIFFIAHFARWATS